MVWKQNGLVHLHYCLFLVTLLFVKRISNLTNSGILFRCQALPANGSYFQHATWQSKSVGLRWRYLFCFLAVCFCLFFIFYIFISVRPFVCLPSDYLIVVFLKHGSLVFRFFFYSEGAVIVAKWRR